MIYQFRMIIRQENARGWRLEEEGERFYLSKFEENYNENEIRFYLKVENGDPYIEEGVRIRKYDKKIPFNVEKNKYAKVAETLCCKYSEKYNKQNKKRTV